MKAIISSTYDDKYMYFIPIVTFLWNKLGVDVICFMPDSYYNFITNKKLDKLELVSKTIKDRHLKVEYIEFKSPKNKEATYAQCSRLYAACLDLPEDEVLITSDVDMAVLKVPTYGGTSMGVVGFDLVPPKQLPMCYIYGHIEVWRQRFKINNRTYQKCLDDLLGNIECHDMRGNYWSKDQEEAYNKILGGYGQSATLIPRAKAGTQIALNRYDRDDAYLLDRLSPDTIDFHMPRPGYEEKNLKIILKILQYHYPNENFQWLIDYTNEFKKLL